MKSETHLRTPEGETPGNALCFRAKRKESASPQRAVDLREMRATSLERRRDANTGERGTSDASTFSNLNFCAQATIGRQTSWSVITITASIVPRPYKIARMSPALAAVWR